MDRGLLLCRDLELRGGLLLWRSWELWRNLLLYRRRRHWSVSRTTGKYCSLHVRWQWLWMNQMLGLVWVWILHPLGFFLTVCLSMVDGILVVCILNFLLLVRE